MIILVDGYNLLKQIFPRVKGKLDKERQQLIHQLGFYKRQRADKVKEIIIVFDGGEWGRATREIREGIVVVFSGQKETADDWLIRYAEQNQGKEILLVTRDRSLIDKCRNRNVEVLKGLDFYEIVKTRLLQDVERDLLARNEPSHETSLQKYEKEVDDNIGQIESEALDMLMEQAPVDEYGKDEKVAPARDRGKSSTLSKKDKRRFDRLKKL